MTSDTISRFNRDTVCLASGVLGILVFAALMLANQERQPEARPDDRRFLMLPDSVSAGSLVRQSSNASDETIPIPGSIVDQPFTEAPSKGMAPAQADPTTSTPTSIPGLTPEIDRNAPEQDSAREEKTKTRVVKHRSAVAFGSVEVKKRLLELWHQSLARNKKIRNWTAFSNLATGTKKKAAYTAETNH